MDKIIEVNNVSMSFTMTNDKVTSLKEFIVRLIKRQLKFKKFQALKNISFDVYKGEVIGIIGHNGAGKSTLLKVISGILKPTKGTVSVYGNVVPMLELGAGFDMDMTGRENIYLNGTILGYSKKFIDEKFDQIVEFSEIKDFIDAPIRTYSSGMITRLAFSIASVIEPEILIVDEILSVGDINFQAKSLARMKELMQGGSTVLLVNHGIETIQEICDKVIWIEHGEIIKMGEAKVVCDAYLEASRKD